MQLFFLKKSTSQIEEKYEQYVNMLPSTGHFYHPSPSNLITTQMSAGFSDLF